MKLLIPLIIFTMLAACVPVIICTYMLAASVTENNAKTDKQAMWNAYRTAVTDTLNELDDVRSVDAAFSIADLDGNGTPELLISNGYCHSAHVSVYTFSDKLVPLGNYGSNGVLMYCAEKNIILSGYMGQGCDNSTYYSIENGEIEKLHSFYDNLGYVGDLTLKIPLEYKIDDELVTKEEYDSAKQEFAGLEFYFLGRDIPLSENMLNAFAAEADDWQTAYQELLAAFMSIDSQQIYRFSLSDINSDNTPELIISNDTIRLSKCFVFSFDGGLIPMGTIGAYGCMGYTPKNGLVYSSDLHQGYNYIMYYSIDDNHRFKKEKLFFNDLGAAEKGEEVYKIDGEEVSKEEYEATLEEYRDAGHLSLGLDHKLSEGVSVIQQYASCNS